MVGLKKAQAYMTYIYISNHEDINHKQNRFKTCWDMYDPAIATVHHELMSVERGNQVDVCGHFSHMNL
jgi:hypothetical protein